MIPREIYLNKLRQLKDQNLIKVITGIRRSGKSTLLKLFRNELVSSGVSSKNIIFLNFEERENLIKGVVVKTNVSKPDNEQAKILVSGSEKWHAIGSLN